jgi:hypothetical protein
MSITIKPCTLDDAEAMIETGEAAFAEDALNNLIFNAREATPEQRQEYKKWRVATTKQRLTGEGKHYFKAVDESNGRLVGYVGLFNPSIDVAAQSTVPKPAFVNPDTDEVMKQLQAVDKKWVGDRKDVWCESNLSEEYV